MMKPVYDFDLRDARIRTFTVRNLGHLDWFIVGFVFSLAAIGLATLHSASMSGLQAAPRYDLRQAVWLCVGLIAAGAIICTDHRFMLSLAPLMYVGALALLTVVLILGIEARGGQSWLRLGPFRFQPSEVAKIALVYMLAWYFTKAGRRIRKLRFLLLAFAIAAMPCLFVVKQNDLGTALTFLPVVFAMLFVAGCRRRHLFLVALLGAVSLYAAWPHLKEHHRERVLAFIDPAREQPKGKDYRYHQIQSKITVGSGRMKGKGFGQGTQTHLNYLPEYHTDFIFSLLAEEGGFIGAALVVGLFMALLLRALALARTCPEPSGSLVIAGCVTVLAVHAFANIAITIGLMPVIGLPLPFLSYGGSFYLTTMMCVGAVLNAPIRKGYFTG
ncbi:MAG TPA: rod shape-determining protein RodA [Candidatus Hydrogenedentes bacterium]|nr:rod shape-determining protein RodA [Candidatus Hydrogenedentota bacterium]HIJ73080.1 rod shape-determining protein RodA [Candidatus Hydrogenedentota bacterium]